MKFASDFPSIADCWNEFDAGVLRPDIDPIKREAARCAFYAGFMAAVPSIGCGNDPHALEYVASLKAEVRAFVAERKQRRKGG